MNKVLVVDDNNDIREILRTVLELWGYEVCDAEGGVSGLRTLHEENPDILLLDYNMPDMNGVEVARAAREVHEQLPIIFITAQSAQLAQEVDELPKTDLLQKPFNLNALKCRIKAMLH